MTVLKVDCAYEQYCEKYRNHLDGSRKRIDKTVDLFSRIKDSKQAEEVTTVLFASRRVKEKNGTATEQELLDYILDWKKSWDDEAKKASVSSTIRHLEMMNWLKLSYAGGLHH